jgi:hypothetical protein
MRCWQAREENSDPWVHESQQTGLEVAIGHLADHILVGRSTAVGDEHAEGCGRVADGDRRADHRVARRGNHRHRVVIQVRDIDFASVRGHRHATGASLADGYGRGHRHRVVITTPSVDSGVAVVVQVCRPIEVET